MANRNLNSLDTPPGLHGNGHGFISHLPVSLAPQVHGMVRLFPIILVAACGLLSVRPLLAQSPVDPIHLRFANSTDETPDFQKHISPLLGRLGCNGRACHGSFQGRGGFQLSLFGFDFRADLKALLDPERHRVVPGKPEDSLIVTKPVDDSLHEGGQRFEPNSWQQRVLQSWIQNGAHAPDAHQLKALRVIPEEIRFLQDADPAVQLQVIAQWEDGSLEDVTPLCRFQSNDSSLAEVDEHGSISPKPGRGDTHVVVFYDKGVTPVPILRPYQNTQPLIAKPTQPRTTIDRLIQQKLDKIGVTPSPVCDDATFLRRAMLDVAGTLPTEPQVRQFVSDPNPDKRVQMVERLLATPSYAAWWTTLFCDWTGNNTAQLQNAIPNQIGSELWYEWIYKRIDENQAYDKIVEGLVLASSRDDGESYLDYCAAMSESCRNPEKYADRDGMTLYWARGDFRTPDQRAIGFAHAFLGVRIQCAQCHKHPFDQWSKEDFAEFSKIFSQVQLNPNAPNPKQLSEADRADLEKLMANIDVKNLKNNDLRRKLADVLKDGGVVPFAELSVKTSKPTKPVAKKKNKSKDKKETQEVAEKPVLAKGQFLGGGEVTLDQDARIELMRWLREKDNPYFAASLVNRVWTHYFGIGIVDPPDDLNLANPPSNAPLLAFLANGFIESGYDLHWLHRTIIDSDAYQRSWESNPSNSLDHRNFSHAIPHRLPAEVLYDAVAAATGNDEQFESMLQQRRGRAISVPESDSRRGREYSYAFGVFGRSTRKSNCDCDRTDEPTVLQTIYLRNDKDVLAAIQSPKSWIRQVAEGRFGPNDLSEKSRREARQKAIDRLTKLQTQFDRFKDKPNKEEATQKIEQEIAQLRQELHLGPNDPIDRQQLAAAATREPWSDQELHQLIEKAYLRTLSRFPSQQESETSLAFIREAKFEGKGLEGLVWALINTKEFSLNH